MPCRLNDYQRHLSGSVYPSPILLLHSRPFCPISSIHTPPSRNHMHPPGIAGISTAAGTGCGLCRKGGKEGRHTQVIHSSSYAGAMNMLCTRSSSAACTAPSTVRSKTRPPWPARSLPGGRCMPPLVGGGACLSDGWPLHGSQLVGATWPAGCAVHATSLVCAEHALFRQAGRQDAGRMQG